MFTCSVNACEMRKSNVVGLLKILLFPTLKISHVQYKGTQVDVHNVKKLRFCFVNSLWKFACVLTLKHHRTFFFYSFEGSEKYSLKN